MFWTTVNQYFMTFEIITKYADNISTSEIVSAISQQEIIQFYGVGDSFVESRKVRKTNKKPEYRIENDMLVKWG